MKSKSSIKSLIIFLSIMLVAMLSFGITGALYRANRQGFGTMVMDKGLYFTVTNIYTDGNLSSSGYLQYYPSGSSTGPKADFQILSGVGQNETYLMATPQIVVESKSLSFYARAKIEYKYYTLSDAQYVLATAESLGVSLEQVTSELFAQKLEFTNRWKLAADGFYYYVAADAAEATNGTLALINPSETVDFFSNNVYETGEWEGASGGPYGIAKMEVVFTLEVVEERGLDWVL